MFKSATFKLTLWYIAIVMAISLGFSFIVYHLSTDELARSLNQQTEQWYNKFPAFDDDPFFSHHPTLGVGRHDILIRLAYFNVLVLIGAGVASYALARMTLSPIEEAHARQKRFTADVSHELRTPLTALRMESEVGILDSSLTIKDLKEILSSNIEETQKLEDLINNILRLSRLDEGQVKLVVEKLDSKEITDTAIERVIKRAEAKNIEINNEVKSLPVYGDRSTIIQIIIILLDNAIKYSHEDTKISIDSHKATNFTKILITDQGVGMKPDELKHVFDRFYRADKSRSNQQQPFGYGLGLSIAKNLAELNQANIALTSRVGQGTTAELSLTAEVGKSNSLQNTQT